ncbi:MAG: ComF family protein [Proteobacteria bacterium]|nr:ComF family protein [Pseudomonadota bacterium]MBU2226775.1 ComF family protein [Pseudomonadota bacterium]MBU2262407.1 ComF family protein [Pseudomonadota bacterium]
MKEVLTGLADVIFPPRCLTCGVILERHDSLPFCPPCLSGIRFIRSPLCSRCGVPFSLPEGADHLCGDCLVTQRPYAIARAVGYYEETLLTAIHLFKYRGRMGIGEVLGRIMADFAGVIWDMKVFSLLLPVPLHRKRLQERGFNQAVILARSLSKRFSIPLDFMTLRREVPTAPQVGLGLEERWANVRGAFAVRKPEKIAGRRVLLVDDVFTTGSTLSECAAVLMQAEAEAVAVLTLARAVHGHDVPADPGVSSG